MAPSSRPHPCLQARGPRPQAQLTGWGAGERSAHALFCSALQGLLPPEAASLLPWPQAAGLSRPGSALPRAPSLLHCDLRAARGVYLSRRLASRAVWAPAGAQGVSLPPPHPGALTLGKGLAWPEGARGEARVRGQRGRPLTPALTGGSGSTPEGLPGRGAVGHGPINGCSWNSEPWAL